MGFIYLQNLTDAGETISQKGIILKTLTDAGSVVIVIVVGYLVLKFVVAFFQTILSGDREDFNTIKTIWKDQAKLQIETNEIHRATNELLIKMAADYAVGRDAAVERIIVRVNDLFDETKTIDVKLENIKEMLTVLLERNSNG